MIVILLISIGLTGVIAGMYPVELRRIEGFGEDESFGQIEGFGEETDPDEEEEEENEEKKDTEKKPEKETKKPETKKPEKETKKPETKKPEKETKKPEKDKEKETKKPESKGSDDIQKILGDSEKYSFTKMPKFDLPSTDEVMGGFEDKLLNIYKETMQNLVEKANLNN
jgi:hypothetical protein